MKAKFELNDSINDISAHCNDNALYISAGEGEGKQTVFFHAATIFWLIGIIHRGFPSLFRRYIEDNFIIKGQ